MAPQFERVDPRGQNYDLQPNAYDNGLVTQVFDGRQPLWERSVRTVRYENEPQYFQFDGSSRDQRLERANDYRNPQTFDNPFRHLQNAHEKASRYGAQAAFGDYQSAIAAADRIDQRQVARDIQSNDRAIDENSARLMRAGRMGASREQMKALQDERVELEREKQFLDNMRMAPIYARANAAFCFIAKGNDQLFRTGENLLRQALQKNPEIEWNYYFNEHRDRAYQEHNRRMAQAQEQRRYPPSHQPLRPAEANPYELQGPNDGQPALRPPVTPQRPPERQIPQNPQRPPEQNPQTPQRPPEQTPQRPPEQTPQRPPEQTPPAQRPPERSPANNPTEAQPAAKPFDITVLAPSGDLYSPAGPPGLGESAPGEAFSSEKDGKGGWDIDWRELVSKKTDAQGNIVYNYKGEIDDSNGWLLGLDGDTNFTAQETVSPAGQLLRRVMTYDGSLSYKVKTENGPREIKDVHKITTTFNEATKKFETEMECADGAIYKAETDLSGKVTKFSEAQTKVNAEAPGLKQANVSNFANSGEVYHVARPIGIGGAVPGWAGGDNDVLDFRKTQVTRSSDGKVTYKYEGEIEDSSGWVLGMNGDTNFEGQEILDDNNNFVSSFIKYGSAKDMNFIGVGGQPISISNVVEVRTSREADGNFTSTVKDSKGATWTIKFKADGSVTEVK
ncbi:MAG: hypothetical protein K2Y39_08140 [Candidatus Obscuribacterales bacterium]|nr:hypothetical protein [Candidatus Obscuribacterales bacterium]